jgi:hypothetical protein
MGRRFAYGKNRSTYRTSPEGKRELGRPRSKLKGNIKLYLKEIRSGGVD